MPLRAHDARALAFVTEAGTRTNREGRTFFRTACAHAARDKRASMTGPVCVISGVGPGTGSALARRFARGGYLGIVRDAVSGE